MRVEFSQDDPSLDQGYAKLFLFKEEKDSAFYEQGNSIALGKMPRPNEIDYLSHDGEKTPSPVPEPLSLEKISEDAGKSVIFLMPPRYVDNMDNGPYQVCLLGENNTIQMQAIMMVYGISWSPLKDSGTLQDYEQQEKKRQEQNITIAPQEPVPAPQSAPIFVQESEPTPQTESLVMPQAPQPAERKSSKTSIIAGIIIVALFAGGSAWYMMNKNNSDNKQVEQQVDQAKEQQAQAQRQKELEREAAQKQVAAEAAKKAEEEKATAEVASKDTKKRVATFFSGERDPQVAMQLASELDVTTPEQQDAVFRLYYYAANQDIPEGILHYAECLDPSKPAWGSVKKNGAEAWRSYGKLPNGSAVQAQLKQWIQQAAKQGNASAIAWLREIQ